MEARFYHGIKKVINTFYLKIQTICLRIDRAVRNNWRILTFFLEFSYISQYWPFSLNSEFASWLLFICELKSHSYFFIIFILWQKETSIVFTSSCKGRCWSSLSLCLEEGKSGRRIYSLFCKWFVTQVSLCQATDHEGFTAVWVRWCEL